MRRLRADARAHALNWCVQRRVCVCVTQARARSCVRCGGAAAHTHTHTHTQTHALTNTRLGDLAERVLARYSRGTHGVLTQRSTLTGNSAAVRRGYQHKGTLRHYRVLTGTPTHPAEYAELFRFLRARLRDARLSGAHPSMVCVAWHRRALQLARYSHARHLWVLYRTVRRLSRLCRALQRRVWHYGVNSCFVWVSYAGVGN